MGLVESGMKSIHSFLVDKKYFIPDYQREYAWSPDEELEDLWQDLLNCTDENRIHFFGLIVMYKDDNERHYIIDGQQRTSSSIILLAVFRDIFNALYNQYKNEDASYKYDDIRRLYIGRFSPTINEIRLTLGVTDKDFFREQIQLSRPNAENITQISHKRILEAYYYFEKRLTSILEPIKDESQKIRTLVKYYNAFLNNFRVLTLVTDDMNEAFVIFETLNARGKELETSDLLKNHLFRMSAGNIEITKEKWLQMVYNLDGNDPTKFIRYFWNSRRPFVREKNLYKRIRDEISTVGKCLSFMSELESHSEIFSAVIDPENTSYFDAPLLNQSLQNIRVMGATSFCPIILAMWSKDYLESDITKVARAIEVLVFRNFLVAGLTANRYELDFSNFALAISKDEFTNADKIVEAIKTITQTDEQFEAKLNLYEVKSVPIAKFVLRSINSYFDKEIIINPNSNVIHLEHIMPIKTGAWAISKDDHAKYLHRLGNLTLLLDEFNRSISNKTFEKKKETYDKSKIEITKQLLKYDRWTPREIEKRQKELTKIIMKTWSI